MMLRLVSKEQTPCWPWRLRVDEQPIGEECVACGQDVALPRTLAGREALCLYCALESGLLPPVEIEPSDVRTLHAIAIEAATAGETPSGSTEGKSAGPQGIAPTQSAKES